MAALAAILEGGNINLGSSSIVSDVITIQPQKYNSNWKNFYFKITGANGWQPDFKCVWADHYEYSLSEADSGNLYPRYTYTPNDPDSWIWATANSNDGTHLTWTFPSAFDQDTVYVSLYEIVTPSMILSWIGGLSGISETASAIAYDGDDYQYGVIPAVTDENGRTIPAQKQYCFKFGTGSKTMVLFGGVHAAEYYGSIALMTFIDEALSSGSVAKQFRDDYTVYVYPIINPQGRYGGHYRLTFEDGYETIDPNRDWNDSTGFDLVCTGNTKDAVADDVTVGDVDWFMDFHDKSNGGTMYRNHSTASANDIKFLSYFVLYQSMVSATEYPTTADTTRGYYGADIDDSWTAEFATLEVTLDKYSASSIYGRAIFVATARMNWVLYSTNKKYGINLGDNNSSRYYKIPSNSALALPDDDWSIGFWAQTDDNTGSAYQYVIGMGTYGDANSLMIFFREDSVSNPGYFSSYIRDGSSGKIILGDADAGDSKRKLFVVQREESDGTVYFRLYMCEEGGNCTRIASDTFSIGAVSASDFYIGVRNDLSSTRFYEEHICGLFKADFALEKWEIEQIAWGLSKPSDTGTLELDLPLTSADATVTDLANGLVATRYGSSWPTPSVEFVYPAESLLPINVTGEVNFSGALTRQRSYKRSIGGSI